MPAEEAEARRAARAKEPHAPSIQAFLRQALDFHARLRKDKRLKRAALAREAGISPTRLTQILHLADLSPQARQLVMALPPGVGRGPSERDLRAIARGRNPRTQVARVRRLLGEAR